MMALSSAAQAVNLLLLTHNQTSGGGAVSTLITDGSHVSGLAPASTVTWDWDGTTLTSAGRYSAVSSIGSSPTASTVLSDQITDLSIDTTAGTASATSYACLEGTFLADVGASGCGGHNLGANYASESTTTWGPGLALSRVIGGDDVATGPQRDIAAYDFGEIQGSAENLNDVLFIGNGIDVGIPGGELLSFAVIASAVDDRVSAAPGVLKNIPVLANDVLRSPITDLAISSPPSEGGTAIVKADNTIDYTPGANFAVTGRETFEYTLTDPGGPGVAGDPMVDPPIPDIPAAAPTVLTATVTVTDGPDASDDGPIKIVTDTTGTIDVLANDGGLSDLPLTVVAPFSAFPALGSATVVGSPGDTASIRIHYIAGSVPGPDSFDYEVTDFLGKTSTATVQIDVALPVFPDAIDDIGEVYSRSGSSVSQTVNVARVNVLANDVDLDDTPLTVTILSPPSNGQNGPEQNFNCFSEESDCQVSYVPDPGFVGTDSFDYTVTDADGDSDTATVTVTVNELPNAINDEEFVLSNGSTSFYVLTNDEGLNSLPVHDLFVHVPPSRGTVQAFPNASPAAARIVYTPNPGVTHSSDWFRYTVQVQDGNGIIASSEARVDVSIILDQGEAVERSGSKALSPVSVGLLAALMFFRRRRKPADA